MKVVGAAGDRYALVCFKKPEDVEKALEVSHDKLFFGCKIEVAPYQGYDVEDNEFRPYEAELDEYHPKATRTLFIGNLEKDVTASELRKHFEPFGEIIVSWIYNILQLSPHFISFLIPFRSGCEYRKILELFSAKVFNDESIRFDSIHASFRLSYS